MTSAEFLLRTFDPLKNSILNSMKALFTFLVCVTLIVPSTYGQTEINDVRQLLNDQSEAWNNGDIEAFMEGYTKTDDLHFLGSSGLTKGWDATLARYQKGYPDRQTMGQLTFDLKEITLRTDEVCTVIGRYHLERSEMDDASGNFLIVLQKIDGNWKIVADSTH